MNNETLTSVEKGDIGERLLTTWFRENDIPFFPIKQSRETFTHFFARTGKRPDFFVLLHSLATIAVDAKNCKLSHGYFTLNKKEVLSALTFEITTRMPYWFAFLLREHDMTTWYWISALKAIEHGDMRINGYTGEKFLAVKLCDFVPMRSRADFWQLCTTHMQQPPQLAPVL